jgi:hypothetical protein
MPCLCLDWRVERAVVIVHDPLAEVETFLGLEQSFLVGLNDGLVGVVVSQVPPEIGNG